MICDACKGERYSRQCRNSAAWREAQDAPEECPHGIELNNLAIGDNAPSPRLRSTGAPQKNTETAHMEIPRVCKWRERRWTGGCCDYEYLCMRWQKTRRIDPTACDECSEYTPRERVKSG